MFYMYLLLSLAVLYVVTATVFLLIARIEKDKDGILILDPESRHFKMSYPFLKFKKWQVEELSEKISLCRYFAKFFFMLYIGWPTLAVWCSLKTVAYAPFMFLFSRYPIANIRSMSNEYDSNELFNVKVGHLRLLKVRGVTVHPFGPLAILAYLLSWAYFPSSTFYFTRAIVIIITAIAVIATVVVGICWLLATDQGGVSLIREWVMAKKKGMCPPLRIKVIEN